jgi:hypothetical protein
MDSRTVRFSRMDNVVVMIFPSPEGAKDFAARLQTADLLQKLKLGKTNMPTVPVKPSLGTLPKPRIVA